MQLYALGRDGHLISASKAEKHHDYKCMECSAALRLRSGPHRQSHFYHLVSPDSCRQHGKTLPHLQTQSYLQGLLGSECYLEHRFPKINRIADVYWASEKIIFEIQCSGITAEEVRNRNKDYESLGLHVVWIFHEHRFNRRLVTAAEGCLREHPYYFTNIDETGAGTIYQQFDTIDKGHRKNQLGPLAIDVTAPRRLADRVPIRFAQKRYERYSLYFAGDLTDLSVNNPTHEYVVRVQALERMEQPISPSWMQRVKDACQRYILWPYMVLFRALLEKASQ
jgi:competence protein CoiA